MSGRERVLERIQVASQSGADLVTLWRDVSPLLASAVPHFESPCFFTVDPASLLTTSHFQEGLPEIPAEWLGRDYAVDDYNSMPEVLASPRGFGTLHHSTGGRPELATKYHEEMQPFGCDQELLVALRARDGETWGLVGLYREQGRALFDEADIAFVREAAPYLAEGARQGLLCGQAEEPDFPDAPGVVVLDESLQLESHTTGAVGWLTQLGGGAASLPVSVYSVAGQAIRRPDRPAVARVPTVAGRWMVLHASLLRSRDGVLRISVIIEPAEPARLAPLLMRAYGLSPREQDVTRIVLRGASTAEVAAALAISEGTVQQHLKSIFDKTGVRSRRELVGRVFVAHYEPRVRDNEQRTVAGRPARHGPMMQPLG